MFIACDLNCFGDCLQLSTCVWDQCAQLRFIDRLAMHEESSTRRKVDDNVHEGALPAYLLDRDETTRAKVELYLLLFFHEKLRLELD